MKKAFTIIELLLAIGLLAVLLVTSGVVFKVASESYVTASATAEIARKLRGITDQLNADFRGLRKDGEIFVVWGLSDVDDDNDGQIDRYERVDRIAFFADGDFQSYNEWPSGAVNKKVIRGDVARICYTLAKNGNGLRARELPAKKRILARSQHIYTADTSLVDDPVAPTRRRKIWIDPADIPTTFTEANNNYYEYDNLTLDEWINLPWVDKADMLSIISDVRVSPSAIPDGGLTVDPDMPLNVHQLLCEGVGDFSVQSWYAPQQRWIPELDPDDDGDLSNSDFFLNGAAIDTANLPGVLYPYGAVVFPPGSSVLPYPPAQIDEANFDQIPGLGRALKFTFTLYDSRGVFKDGKKFTHIVYLDE